MIRGSHASPAESRLNRMNYSIPTPRGRRSFLAFAAILSLASVLGTAPPQTGAKEWSRVYVSAHGCERDRSTLFTSAPAFPEVELYDQSQIPKTRSNAVEFGPCSTEGLGTNRGAVGFYFDITPGYYELFLSFRGRSPCGANGPLIVIPGAARRMVVFAENESYGLARETCSSRRHAG